MTNNIDRTWFGRVGVATDEWLNTVLFDGDPAMTVSMHAAEAEQAGRTWGCWVCWVLGVLVQRHHCAITLSDQPEAAGAAVRAAVVIFAVLGGMCWAGWTLVSGSI